MDEDKKSFYEDAKRGIIETTLSNQKEDNINKSSLNNSKKLLINKALTKQTIIDNGSSSYQDAYSKPDYIKVGGKRAQRLKSFIRLNRNLEIENNNENLTNIKIITNQSAFSANSYTIPQFEIYEKESGCCNNQINCGIF